MLSEYPLPPCHLAFNGRHRPHALCLVKVRDRPQQMGKLCKQVRHASALIIDQQESRLMRMKIHCQRQDIGLHDFRLSGTGGSRHQPVWAVGFLMKVQFHIILLCTYS